MPTQPQLWTLNGLSVELKIYRSKLAEALATLPPDLEDGKEKRWLMHKVVAHLGQVGPDAKAKLDRTQEDARLKKVMADTKILELARLRGELIQVEDAGLYFEALALAFRQRVMAIPRRMAPTLVGKKAKEIEAKARKELGHALNALAKLNPDDLIKKLRSKNKAEDPEQAFEIEQP